MRNTALLFASIGLTVLCWGFYGPVLQAGQVAMSTDWPRVARLRPFVCVGLAYFLIGVIVPSLWLYLRGEKGEWTVTGLVWSFAGGALGAIGALGIILAFTFGGSPILVMPLVFGGAPVVNAFLTIYMSRRLRDIGPLFLAGLVIVIMGAVAVLIFAPHPHRPATAVPVAAAQGDATHTSAVAVNSAWHWALRLLSIALAIASWGSYGPVLHKGQAAMQHSRLRPLIWVGLAYFVIAVIVPYFFLAAMGENSTYASWGTLWSLLAGACGAVGALGIIMSFHTGGRPVFVMPLVFGGAPVVNTLFSIARQNLWQHVNPFFWSGLILVIAGAAMVLVFAPRGEGRKRIETGEPEPTALGD